MAAWLELTDLTKSYGDAKILDQISLSVEKGEILALVGPSGTGKSTLLKAVAGLVELDGGSIRLAGREITFASTQERKIGMVFQDYSLFPSMSLRENVAFPLMARQTDGVLSVLRWKLNANFRQAAYARADEVLSLVHLQEHSQKRPDQVSGGEQQRAAFARAVAFDPDLLCLDEPFSALDRNLRIELQQQIRDLQHQLGTTMLYVTHDQSEAMLMANRIAIMHCGKLEQIGTPEQLYTQPVNAFVARFLGDCNILPVARLEVFNGRVDIWTSAGTRVSALAAGLRGRHVIALRPEKLFVRNGSVPDAPHLAGRVDGVTFLGPQLRFDVRLDSGDQVRTITFAESLCSAPRHGDRVYLEYNPQDVCVISGESGYGSEEFDSERTVKKGD